MNTSPKPENSNALSNQGNPSNETHLHRPLAALARSDCGCAAVNPRAVVGMKTKEIEKAIKLLRDAIREKFGEETQAQIIIREDSVSLDGENADVICDETLEDAVALELKP